MRVIPLTSVLSHEGRGCRWPKPFYTVSLEVKELIKLPQSSPVLSGNFSQEKLALVAGDEQPIPQLAVLDQRFQPLEQLRR